MSVIEWSRLPERSESAEQRSARSAREGVCTASSLHRCSTFFFVTTRARCHRTAAMPRASTSAQTLDTPGFRKSTPRRAAAQRATTTIASTSAQLLRDAAAWQEERTGKGKARADDNESQWEGDEASYGPQKGQVKRRQKRQSASKDERASKRRKLVGTTAPQLPKLPSTPMEGPRGKTDAASTGPARVDAAAAATSSPPPRPARKKRRKQVRIAQLAPLPTSDESSAYEPGSASEDDEPDLGFPGPNAALGLAGQATVDADWADPLSIPTAQPVRGRRYWQALELGIVTSAVHDVASCEVHLGRALVQWELLRQRRAAEEADAVLPRDSVVGEAEQQAVGASTLTTPEPESLARQDDDDPDATPRPAKPQRRRRPMPTHDPNRSLTPFPLSRLTADRLEMDDDGVNLLPLPASTALAKMARWPVRRARISTPTYHTQMDALEEALLAQYERARRKEHVSLPALGEHQRARSAYETGGPLDPSVQDSECVLEDSESESDRDSSHGDNELLDEVELLPPTLAAIPSTLDRLLTRLLDFVPKAPSPAYDYWMQKSRTEEMLKDDARAGFVRDRCAPGWEEVLAIAKELELPAG